MPTLAELAAFEEAHVRWAASDLEGLLGFLTDDIRYNVNVDGLAVPYASSALGKEDVRQRLQLLLDTFTIDKFGAERIWGEADHCRSAVVGHYTHRKTGEPIRLRIRFRAWFRDGLIARMNEHHDAAYVEAFQRFVFHLENAVRGE
ncbi:MAG TPA: nuclear transport factor 2 family protein [Hyphomicrobiaceae bacterium]|jgi:ketosteroid isomerase-like protein|nr:nuclear transport factor 2 family protein [Hyphomicrobiaceae bacterium]